jgi:hypothetical protein
MDETLKIKRLSAKPTPHCLFCGEMPEPPEILLEGQKGSICRGCVYALAARLVESDRESGDPGDATGMVTLSPETAEIADSRSAHDYQTRIDLAAAYMEMGRKNAAVNELLTAVESALLCADYQTALRCAARTRKINDGPTLRDRIVDIFTRNAPHEEEGDSD